MAATTAITTAALSNVFISASQCPEGNLLKTGPECKRTRAKARDYIWEPTSGMAPGCSGSTFGMAPGWSGSTFGLNVVAGFSPRSLSGLTADNGGAYSPMRKPIGSQENKYEAPALVSGSSCGFGDRRIWFPGTKHRAAASPTGPGAPRGPSGPKRRSLRQQRGARDDDISAGGSGGQGQQRPNGRAGGCCKYGAVRRQCLEVRNRVRCSKGLEDLESRQAQDDAGRQSHRRHPL